MTLLLPTINQENRLKIDAEGCFQPPKSKVIGLWFNTYINNAKEITVVTDIVPIYNIFEVLFLF